jgi:hypothetical protein
VVGIGSDMYRDNRISELEGDFKKSERELNLIAERINQVAIR